MADEQKQKYREAKKHKYHNMTDEEKQKYKDYLREYYAAKKLNNKNIKKDNNDNDNDNDNDDYI